MPKVAGASGAAVTFLALGGQHARVMLIPCVVCAADHSDRRQGPHAGPLGLSGGQANPVGLSDCEYSCRAG